MLIVTVSGREPLIVQDDPQLEADVFEIVDRLIHLKPVYRKLAYRFSIKMQHLNAVDDKPCTRA